MTRRSRRARHLRRRRRVLVGKRSATTPTATALPPLHARRRQPELGRRAPTPPSGVLFNGMTADGPTVFFTTARPADRRHATPAPTSTGADVGATGADPSSWVSTGTGGTGNTDGCTPAGPPNWNAAPATANAAPSPSPAAPASPPETAPSTSSARSSSTARQRRARTRPTSTSSSPARRPHFVGTIDTSVGKPAAPAARLTRSTNANFGRPCSNARNRLAVDQANGDVYVAETGRRHSRPLRLDRRAAELHRRPRSRHQRIAGPRHRPARRRPGRGRQLGAARSTATSTSSPEPSFERESRVYSPTRPGDADSGQNLNGPSASPAASPSTSPTATSTSATTSATSGASRRRRDPGHRGQLLGAASRPKARAAASSPPTGGHVYAAGGGIRRSQALQHLDVRHRGRTARRRPSTVITADGRSRLDRPDDRRRLRRRTATRSSVYDDDTAATLIETFGTRHSRATRTAWPSTPTNARLRDQRQRRRRVRLRRIALHADRQPRDRPRRPAAGGPQLRRLPGHPDGRYALFSSALPLTGYDNRGHSRDLPLRRRRRTRSTAPPARRPARARARRRDAVRPRPRPRPTTAGSSSRRCESLVLRDTNEKTDAYEWDDGTLELISTGIGQQRLGPAHGQRRRHRRLLLHPRHPRPRRTRTATR